MRDNEEIKLTVFLRFNQNNALDIAQFSKH